MTEDQDRDEAALEQARVRKQAEEAAASERSLRAQQDTAAPAPSASSAQTSDRVWTAPREAQGSGSIGRLLLRMVVFGLLVMGAYLLVRAGSYILFAPKLEALAPVVPTGTVPTDQLTTLGAHVANNSRAQGAAFAVVTFNSGEEVEGATVQIPPGDTVFVPVRVRLTRGEHIFSLLVFDAWRGTRRLKSYSGLSVTAAAREIELEKLVVPETVTRGQPAVIQFMGANPGRRAETVIPVVALKTEGGTALVTQGDPVQIGPRQSGALRVNVATAGLNPGQYHAEVWVETRTANTIGYARYAVPIEVTQ
jgi:hypothetical protein